MKFVVMKNSLSSILGILFLLAGCSTSPFQYVIVDTPDPGRVGLAPPSYRWAKAHPTNWQFDDEVDRVGDSTEQAGTFCMKYHPSYDTKHCIVVDGSIADSKKKYPVVLDTGASQGIFVNDIHVLENKLPTYPIQSNKDNSKDYGMGLCYIPQLRIGQMTLSDVTCWYLKRHLELNFLGLPMVRDDSIIVGLKALREFHFIVLDNINREVEFSRDKAFEPDKEYLWSQYPLSIEEDNYGNAFLFVQIPITGESMKIQLDTGSGNGLSLSEVLWEKLFGKVQGVKLEDSADLYPYIGRLPCKRGVVTQLQVGNRLISNAKLSVFPADSPLLSDCDTILGMHYFQDTVIALDFQNAILWVRNQAL